MAAHPYQLKYVIARPEDLPEVLQQVAELGADSKRVLLMPEGTDPETLRERGRWLAESCKSLGFRYCPRLQVELWGNRRGV
jgi:7-carboxy-7-deazaguanine synthase